MPANSVSEAEERFAVALSRSARVTTGVITPLFVARRKKRFRSYWKRADNSETSSGA
jgi:hypothetical protein